MAGPQDQDPSAVEPERPYLLLDRAGAQIPLSFDELRLRIRQGRLFRTDTIRLRDGSEQQVGDVQIFGKVFAELLPDPGALRASPAIAGEGDTLALLEVFARLFHQQATGRLFVRHDELGHERTVVFRNGVPVAAWSNVEEEWIGEVLVAKGFIDPASFQQAVSLRQESGQRIGSALVKLDKITPRRLQMALSVQALDRLLNIFRAGEGARFRFVLDPSAADEEILLVARPREVIETAIATAMGPAEVKALLDSYGEEPMGVEVPPQLADELNSTDRSILDILAQGATLTQALPLVARAARLTIAEARVRLLALATFGVVQLGDLRTRALARRLEELQSQNYFEILNVRPASQVDAIRAAAAVCRSEFGLGEDDTHVGAVGRVRAHIAALIDKAEATLADPLRRAIYQRAVQMGVDFEDAESLRHVEFDEYMARGQSAVQRKDYDGARESFLAAAERVPEDPRPHVQIGWARFLAADEAKRVAPTAIKEIQRALEVQEDFDVAWLYIGKVQRLAGQLDAAEDSLRKAIALNPRNVEAKSELRLIFTRELSGASRGSTINLSVDSKALGLIGTALLLTGALYVGANHLPGGATIWPEVAQGPVVKDADSAMREIGGLVQLRLQNDEATLVAAAQALNAPKSVDTKEAALAYLANYEIKDVWETLATVHKVPPDKQVLGNVEFYYQSGDGFWWLRRVVMFAVGLLGILLVGRRLEFEQGILGTQHGWLGLALPYGILVGFLSGTVPAHSSMGMLLMMTLVHVLAEQVFFVGFLGRALLAVLDNAAVAVALVAVCYGIYQLSFFAVLEQPTAKIMLDALQIGVFAGGAFAVFLWRSGGLAAPFLAHLLINGVMIFRSALS